jgi:hypothetical protein
MEIEILAENSPHAAIGYSDSNRMSPGWASRTPYE